MNDWILYLSPNVIVSFFFFLQLMKGTWTFGSLCCSFGSERLPEGEALHQLPEVPALLEGARIRQVPEVRRAAALFLHVTNCDCLKRDAAPSTDSAPSGILTASTCWSCCSTSTSGRSWWTLSAPSSSTSSSCCTGSTTPGNARGCSRRSPSSSSRHSSRRHMGTSPPSDGDVRLEVWGGGGGVLRWTHWAAAAT